MGARSLYGWASARRVSTVEVLVLAVLCVSGVALASAAGAAAGAIGGGAAGSGTAGGATAAPSAAGTSAGGTAAAAGAAGASTAGGGPATAAVAAREIEAYQAVPMPPGFRVESTELDGPVFADSTGHTLYTWPQKAMRNGYSGEAKGIPACSSTVTRVTAGLMSPYPPGLELPELDTHPSCADMYPPALAAPDAKPVGKWTIIDRKDGKKQWAFDEQPVYTARQDRQPGDVMGGTTRAFGLDSPAYRVPAKPPSKVPAGFAVKSTSVGRLLTTDKHYSVYAYDKDTPQSSACSGECTKTWKPLVAPRVALAQGEWSIIERSPGVEQWVFRGKPLYTYALDSVEWSLEGSDVPGWTNVFVQHAPAPPADFTVHDTRVGEVLADRLGMTVYRYFCADDSVDQLSCDHPDDTQVYRLAMCGGGDPARCSKNWRYVLAQSGAMSSSRSWTIAEIDPKTGHRATPGESDALRVWAYRDRPVYTYGGDTGPGDINGTSTGEWRGQRNGLRAFSLRDEFSGGAL